MKNESEKLKNAEIKFRSTLDSITSSVRAFPCIIDMRTGSCFGQRSSFNPPIEMPIGPAESKETGVIT